MFSAVYIYKALLAAFCLDEAAGKTQVTLMPTAAMYVVCSVSWRGD